MSFDTFGITKRLYERLTQARADLMDNLAFIPSSTMSRLDVNVSSRADESTTAKSSVCTEQRLAKLEDEIRGLKSNKHYTATMVNNVAQTDVSITAVSNVEKAVLHITWRETTANGSFVPSRPSARFLNTTTVRLEHYPLSDTKNQKVVELQVEESY